MQLTIQVEWLQVRQTSVVSASSTLRLGQQDHDGIEIELWLSEAGFVSLQQKTPRSSERDIQQLYLRGDENPCTETGSISTFGGFILQETALFSCMACQGPVKRSSFIISKAENIHILPMIG